MKEQILYIAPWKATFVDKDIRMLSDSYKVVKPISQWTNKYLLPYYFLRQGIFLIVHMRQSSAILIMFAGYWSFLPTLFGKLFKRPCYIILGGTDCVSFPSLNYGSFRKSSLKWFIKKSCEWCTELLPVDESLIKSENHYVTADSERNQGLLNQLPNLRTPFTVIPNGFEFNNHPLNTEKTPNSFITIAQTNNEMRWKLKGLDMVVELANHLPECSFTIIGAEFIPKSSIPSNLNIFPFLDYEEFGSKLAQSEFYLQLSLSEGFPNALCEGMLAGCIPVVSAVGAMPMIVNNPSLVIPKANIQEIIDRVKKLLKLTEIDKIHLQEYVINRIKENFSLQNRKYALDDILYRRPLQ